MSKRRSKVDYSQYTNEEIFYYFKEALFEGNFEVAENCMRELLRRIDSGNVTSEEEKILYWKGMGLLCEMTNRDEEARQYFFKVLEVKPDDEESLEHIKRLSGLE